MRRSRIIAMMLALLAIGQSRAKPDLLIDPAGGTVLFGDSSNQDDASINGRSLGFTGHFFGDAETTVDVSTNGVLSFSGNSSYQNQAFPYGPALIAPLWDDLYLYQGTGQSITEKVSAGQYYAVTWDLSQYSNTSTQAHFTFQATWFGAPTTIGAFQFQADDIVFSYSQVSADFAGGDATVGLNKGVNGIFTPLLGDGDGLITNSQVNLLPTGPADVILFRTDGSGQYTASVINTATVPEPASIVLCGSGLAIGLFGFARRRKAGRASKATAGIASVSEAPPTD